MADVNTKTGTSKKPLEKRTYNFNVRAEQTTQGENIITGRPIVYESVDDMGYYEEVIDRGALDNADLTDIRFLVNHDLSKIPLARSRRNNGNSTMKLTPDYEGLSLDFAKLDTENNAEARALYSAVQRGDISGMSFMFSIDEERWENLESDYPKRHIVKIGKVVEISAVTFPAYENTTINARSNEALESARLALESARASVNKGAVDTEQRTANELELAKAKFNFRTKM